jgi:hypothetical protein
MLWAWAASPIGGVIVRIEDVQLSIRQRSLLECLDLTFLFCGRHWVGLLGAAAAGILPLAAFNWWVVNIRDMNAYGAYLWLTLQLPWATIPITLYLGQTTFSRRLSFRRMLLDGVRAIPGLLLFQLIVRGICLSSGVLAPFVFVGMFYLNEIILLEKPSIWRIWNRRVAMNKRILTRIVTIRILDVTILCGGTYVLREMFRAVSSIWDDRFDSLWMMFAGEDSMPFILDRQTYLAFWIVVVFLTVFRFVTYLDGRIRRDGWDVELKLRAQAVLFQKREAVA